MNGWLKGRYEVLETLGSGGEGRVVKALDHQHERFVALKLRPVSTRSAQAELLAEARVLLSVPSHPALPLVREDFFEGDDYVVAMDWVDGINLARLLADRGRPGLAPSSVLAYLAEAAEALTHLHTQSPPVIHGDVKPGNLVLTTGGRVKLVDFGMSSAPGAHRRRIGTPGFRAPELAADGSPSRASDIYALAATAFALLTGSAPSGKLPSWDGVDPAQATQLEEAIRLGLSTDPARRPGTPGEFVERLRAGWAAALPTGVITFCLSDIESSTALWEDQPRAMAEALVRHDELIAEIVEAHGGRFLKSMGEGDSTVSVFDSAAAAAQAAVDATHALSSENWPGDLRIRVRFGLHTGEAERRGTDYFGPTVNLAARLRGQADGGQVFLSAVTADLVATTLGQGFRLVDLGPHRLRNIRTPERVFALAGPGVDAPLAATECPYRGLLSFQPADRRLFFGREAVVGEVLSRLAPGRLLAVVGASGSGKSSLLRAGVVAAVESGEVPVASHAVLSTPGPAPTVSGVTDSTVLVVVDQFEEVYTLCDDPPQRTAFIDDLLALPGPVVIGVRADFYGQLSTHPELAAAVAGNQVLLGPMDEDELTRVIVEPARLAGLRLEPGLVDVVLAELAREPGALPLLSHSLRATWERRDGRTLTVEAYRQTGGVRSAIATTADLVAAALPDEQRRLLRSVLLRLTELGEGVEDTRRRVEIDDLVSEGGSLESVRALLGRLADARLVTMSERTAEVAHEVLIREWPTLRQWLEEDREGLRLHRRLGDAARIWDAGGRDPSDLYRGTRLDAAQEWASGNPDALNATERAFLDESAGRAEAERRAQARSNRRLRRSLVGVGALLVVAVVAAGLALDQRRTADRRAFDATTERIAFESQAIGEDDVITSALLAVEAFRREDSPRTRSALLAALQVAPERLRYFGGPATTLAGAEAITADGHILAIHLAPRLEFYDLRTAQLAPVQPIEPEGDSVPHDFAVTPDGRFAVVARGPVDVTDTIEVWDVVDHRRLATAPLPGPEPLLNDVDISSDGRRVAVATTEGASPRVWILDEDLRPIVGPVSLEPPSGTEVKFCPDDTMVVTEAIAASGQEIEVVFRRADTLAPVHPPATMPGSVNGFMHCSSGRAVAAGFRGAVAVFDPGTGERVAGPFADDAVAGAITPDGTTVLVLGFNGELHRYDAATGEELGPPILTGMLRGDVVVAPDGRRAYVGSTRVAEIALDGTVPVGPVIPGTEGATRTSRSGDGSTLAIVVRGPDGPVTRFVDVASSRQEFSVPGHARYLPDGRSIVTFRPDGFASVGTPDAPASRWEEQVAEPIDGFIQNHVVSNDGTLLAVRPDDGSLRVHDLGTGRLLFDLPGRATEPGVLAVALSPLGDLLAVRRRFAPHIDILDARTGAAVGEPIEVGAVAGGMLFFSADGQTLLVGHGTGPLLVADVETRRFESRTLDGHTARVVDVAMLEDGRTLASVSNDGTLRLWDLPTGTALGRPIAAAGPLTTLDAGWAYGALYPTEHGLLIPTPSGVLDADLRAETLLDRACARAGQNLTRLAFSQHLPGEAYHLTCPQYGEPPAADTPN